MPKDLGKSDFQRGNGNGSVGAFRGPGGTTTYKPFNARRHDGGLGIFRPEEVIVKPDTVSGPPMSPRLEQLKPRQNPHNGPIHGEKSFRHKDLVGVGRNFPVVKQESNSRPPQQRGTPEPVYPLASHRNPPYAGPYRQ